MAHNSLFFLPRAGAYDEKAARKNLTPECRPLLARLGGGAQALERLDGPAIHEVISAVAARYGVSLGKVAQPLRVAVCGGAVSPPIDITVALLGKASR